MDPTELTQFLLVCAIAFAALVAAPLVVALAEGSEHRSERRGRRQRNISTQQPVMQY